MERYGGISPFCDPAVLDKFKHTAESRYGGIGMASPELSKKIRETNLKKYGVEISLQSEDIRAKAKRTILEKYGAEHINQSVYGLRKAISDPSKVEKFAEFKRNPSEYIKDTYGDSKVSATRLSKDLGVTSTPIYDILINSGCRDLASTRSSFIEEEVFQYISELLPDTKILTNVRNVISPMEIDLYIPEKHFGIECNPTITHNSSIGDPWGGEPKPYMYHKHKSVYARNSGVFLFHIFGYEWTHRREVIESMIENILGATKNKIYARNTYVCEVPNSECLQFLNTNHRQGGTYASVRLGLRDKISGELVSVMTFNHMRSTMGKTDCDMDSWELSRFCSKLHTSVVGGASKLFSYFIKNYPYSKIVSFSDIAHTRGSLYKSLGFSYIHESNPSYVWVSCKTDEAIHRVQSRKSNLAKLFPNEPIDIKTKSERQIMEEHGYVRVYDSGTIRWEFLNKK